MRKSILLVTGIGATIGYIAHDFVYDGPAFNWLCDREDEVFDLMRAIEDVDPKTLRRLTEPEHVQVSSDLKRLKRLYSVYWIIAQPPLAERIEKAIKAGNRMLQKPPMPVAA